MGALNRPAPKKKLSSAGARGDEPTTKATGKEKGGDYGYDVYATKEFANKRRTVADMRVEKKDRGDVPSDFIYDQSTETDGNNPRKYRYRQSMIDRVAEEQTEKELNRKYYDERMKKANEIIERNMPRGQGQGGRGDEPTVKATTGRQGGGDYKVNPENWSDYEKEKRLLKRKSFTKEDYSRNPDLYGEAYTPTLPNESGYDQMSRHDEQPTRFRLNNQTVKKLADKTATKVLNKAEYDKRVNTGKALSTMRGNKPANTTIGGSDPEDVKTKVDKMKNPKTYYIKKAQEESQFDDEVYGDEETTARREAIKRELRKKRRNAGGRF